MSKFTTPIPVDVAGAIAALPKGAYVHSVRLSPDRTNVELVWDHDGLISSKCQPNVLEQREFGKKLPAHVKPADWVTWPEKTLKR